jgi:hypothetical protein
MEKKTRFKSAPHPTRKGKFREPPRAEKKTRTAEEKVELERMRRDKQTALRGIHSVSMIQFRKSGEDGLLHPVPMELRRDALPPPFQIVKDGRGYEVLEETTESGNRVRYRIYTRKIRVNPATPSLSGLSRLVSFYRTNDGTLRINEDHPANPAYFFNWHKYIWDDKYTILYYVDVPGRKRVVDRSAVPLGGGRSRASMVDYMMRRYGMTEEDAIRVVRQMKDHHA